MQTESRVLQRGEGEGVVCSPLAKVHAARIQISFAVALVSRSLREPARILREQIKIEGEYERNAIITRRKRSALPLAFMAEGFTMVMGRDKAVITGRKGGEGERRKP